MQPLESLSPISETLLVVAELTKVVDQETELLRAGDIVGGLACAEAKAATITRYVALLAEIRKGPAHNTHWKVTDVAELRRRHLLLEMRLSLNLAVITTIRGVSEGIVRELSQRLAAQAAPRTYGPGARTTPPPGSAPISLSQST